jgi:hypothetical protein
VRLTTPRQVTYATRYLCQARNRTGLPQSLPKGHAVRRWPAGVSDTGSQPWAATRCFARRGDANSVPQTKRITGPYEAAAGRPVKYRPGTEDT